ncbi:hypothetical protein EON65_46290 [archaeon]|nr:MAG: hypothetical protein EON65_46290 [archaeon]
MARYNALLKQVNGIKKKGFGVLFERDKDTILMHDGDDDNSDEEEEEIVANQRDCLVFCNTTCATLVTAYAYYFARLRPFRFVRGTAASLALWITCYWPDRPSSDL